MEVRAGFEPATRRMKVRKAPNMPLSHHALRVYLFIYRIIFSYFDDESILEATEKSMFSIYQLQGRLTLKSATNTTTCIIGLRECISGLSESVY